MPWNDGKFICTSQFIFHSEGTKDFSYLFWLKNLVNMTGFWLMDFASNWHDPGQSMPKRPGFNRVRPSLKNNPTQAEDFYEQKKNINSKNDKKIVAKNKLVIIKLKHLSQK